MHPAKSVIFFTTASGAGYGLGFWLILLSLTGLAPQTPLLGWAGFSLAFVLVTAGLLASTFHLGHPERAWRALSQWRTSWLSREGVAAVATYIPVGLYGAGWVFGADLSQPFWQTVGGLGAALCVITVFCTAMIYASLKPVHAWRSAVTPAAYLALAWATGAVVLTVLVRLDAGLADMRAAVDTIALFGIALSTVIKRVHWFRVTKTHGTGSAESATGLGDLGKVTLLEAPHTEANYLLKEMGFSIARQHAAALWRAAFIAGVILPFALIAVAGAMPSSLGLVLTALAALSAAIGVVVERWLFFAQAKHSVTLYYGADRA
ncbi:MAG: dimethyl sulfoxide reductase anchor subunit [Alphaproteobacteria bacterium]|nr:dimethyl sulfoxide reductase anchor subunit [Alphaproteobacteria bacterium]